MKRLFVLPLLVSSLAFAGYTQEGPGSATFDAKGTLGLKIHGKTKEVSFKYSTSVKDNVVSVDGSADLNLTDFGVQIRSYLKVTVKPDITVAASFALKK